LSDGSSLALYSSNAFCCCFSRWGGTELLNGSGGWFSFFLSRNTNDRVKTNRGRAIKYKQICHENHLDFVFFHLPVRERLVKLDNMIEFH